MNLNDFTLNVFEFTPGRYYLGTWFVNFPPRVSEFGLGGDLNAYVWRLDENPNEWVLQYRFRHYADNKVWGSKDARHWYAGQFKGSEAVALSHTRKALSQIAAVAGHELHEFLIQGDSAHYDQLLKERPPFWLHRGIGDELAARGGKPGGN